MKTNIVPRFTRIALLLGLAVAGTPLVTFATHQVVAWGYNPPAVPPGLQYLERHEGASFARHTAMGNQNRKATKQEMPHARRVVREAFPEFVPVLSQRPRRPNL